MIEYNGETYLTVSEIAQRLGISWGTCRINVLQHIQQCYLPGRKRVHYRLLDVEHFAQVRMVPQNYHKAFPASPLSTDEAGNDVTSSANSSQSSLDWQAQYTLPVVPPQVHTVHPEVQS